MKSHTEHNTAADKLTSWVSLSTLSACVCFLMSSISSSYCSISESQQHWSGEMGKNASKGREERGQRGRREQLQRRPAGRGEREGLIFSSQFSFIVFFHVFLWTLVQF